MVVENRTPEFVAAVLKHVEICSSYLAEDIPHVGKIQMEVSSGEGGKVFYRVVCERDEEGDWEFYSEDDNECGGGFL
jgi:hypothetical protein